MLISDYDGGMPEELTGKWWLRLEFLFDSNVCLISPTEIRNANITHMRGAPRETIENNNREVWRPEGKSESLYWLGSNS